MYGPFLRNLAKDILVYFASLFVFSFIFKRIEASYFRQAHDLDSTHSATTFGSTTSTSNLRKHLFGEHIEQWVTSCDDLKIEITAAAAKAAIRSFHNLPADSPLDSKRPQYSKKAFIDALVEFIVGDDQVCDQYYFIY